MGRLKNEEPPLTDEELITVILPTITGGKNMMARYPKIKKALAVRMAEKNFRG